MEEFSPHKIQGSYIEECSFRSQHGRHVGIIGGSE